MSCSSLCRNRKPSLIATLTLLLSAVSSVTPRPIAAADKPGEAAVPRTQLLKTFMDELIEITPGKGIYPPSFRMGSESGPASEQPVHEVKFAAPFAIAKYEVPQNLYAAVMGENPSRWKGPRNSAEMMTIAEAREFCRKITALLREAKLIGDDEEIRLPTEAQWEYCCRASTTMAYSFGDQATNVGDNDQKNQATILSAYSWHTGNAAGNDPAVGSLKPNPWGLYDVHGYLWEFVEDDWHDDYKGAPADGSAWKSESEAPRITLRGGSWRDRYELHRSATRISQAADFRNDAIGFRCVKVPTADKQGR